ncbi:BTB/POZ domain-containing protein [Acorus gramineus]|uniref:BTB/POZ domain-containing protein n=1 Tax=Acorus gramineus TaxID=55184 RepID=A0AAV9AZ72_ACOGR|nr:BTB/POZ domain-containing protein [Acorus gramineus]
MAIRGHDRVRFNVGGRIFETTTTTLANAGRDSMLGAMLDDNWSHPLLSPDGREDHFIDRNPDCFSVLLDLLRTGELHPSPAAPERLLYKEAAFYGLLDHVRAAKFGPFDGNRLRYAASISGRAPGDGTAIRAAPDGGCCVAHGSMVHVYDWTLDELPPISLDYQRVNDAGYLSPSRLVVTARGGMCLFSASDARLLHRYEVAHASATKKKSFTAGALCFGARGGGVFASCKGRCNEHGIGVWDENTGQQFDFFYDSPDCASLGEADRLQWLDDRNCLMVSTLFPKTDNCFIGLLDLRLKKVVWSWRDVGSVLLGAEEKRVLDAIAIEESGSVCVVNQFDDLGFLDMRGRCAGAVRWSSRSRLMKGTMPDELCYPKLRAYRGQLFSSMNDSVSVFSGHEWVLTSRLRRSYGGSICDFSIGGDRLFVLHSEENVFDVWDAPPLTMI